MCRANYQLTSACWSGCLDFITRLAASLNLAVVTPLRCTTFSHRFVDKHYRWLDIVASWLHLHLRNPFRLLPKWL